MESLKKEIFLIDSSINFEDISLNNFNDNFLFISFDFLTHKLLQKNHCTHKISDEFISKEILDIIQHQAYDLAKWYFEPSVSKLLEYSGVNIGRLLHEQIVVFLVQFLKKVFEIDYIVKHYPNSKFFASGILYEILKLYDVKTTKIQVSQKPILFAHDKVRYNLKIGNRHFLFLIPRNFYLKLKQISEIFIHKLFNPDKLNNNFKTCLFVELPTDRFKELFLESTNLKENSMFFSRRRPAIWNFESYSILKNSNSKIITEYSLSDSKIPIILNKEIEEFSNKICSIFENNEELERFFYINNKSLWKILCPIFSKLINSRIEEFLFEIKLIKKMFSKYEFNSVLILSEVGVTEQIVTKFAHEKDIPVVLLQMGHHHDTKEARETNYSQAVYPINADKFVVWGNISKSDAVENGNLSSENIEVLGSPRYDNVFSEGNNEGYILLAATGPVQMQVRSLTVQTYEEYEFQIQEICKIVMKLGKKLIIKIHPSPTEHDLTDLVKEISPNIQVVTTGDILPLIKSCDLMLVTGLSTSILEAHILKKPVISIPVIDFNLGTPKIFSSNSCLISSIDKLENNLLKIFDDYEFRLSLLERANNFLDNYISNFNSASKKLHEFLLKL